MRVIVLAGLDQSLASGSTINRFQHAFTRREAEKPIEDREVIFEVRRAQVERINAMNDFLIDTFVRTRTKRPAHIIIDLDPTDDPTHGRQQLMGVEQHYRLVVLKTYLTPLLPILKRRICSLNSKRLVSPHPKRV